MPVHTNRMSAEGRPYLVVGVGDEDDEQEEVQYGPKYEENFKASFLAGYSIRLCLASLCLCRFPVPLCLCRFAVPLCPTKERIVEMGADTCSCTVSKTAF